MSWCHTFRSLFVLYRGFKAFQMLRQQEKKEDGADRQLVRINNARLIYVFPRRPMPDLDDVQRV